jgi:cysteine dioxygenase
MELDTQIYSSENARISIGPHTKLDFDNVPVPKDLNELCQILHKVFEQETVNVEYVTKIIENYKSNPKDWRQYAKYDPHKYTRNLIDEGNGKFNVLLLCWAESQGSSIHDHSNAHCFMKCLDGELLETKYEWPKNKEMNNTAHVNAEEEKEMVEKQRTMLKKNNVAYINDSIGLHRIENESHTKPAVTLHVYIPPYNECQGFDLHTGKARLCQVTFHSKYGKKVSDVPGGI